MDYRQLGRSGLTVSVVGLGCNNFGGHATTIAGANAAYGLMDLAASRAVIDAAFDAGITFFDTADLYGNGGSETILGEVLKDRRREVVIATKWGAGLDARRDIAWGSRRYIRQACEASLRRLATDHIDLYQMHWPDPRTPLEETIAALDELVREGKVRYLGHSHFAPWRIADADWIARAAGRERFVAAQDQYSLLAREAEAERLPACARFGVGLLPYFPLANGWLTGKYRRDRPAPEGARMAGKPIDARTYDVIEALAAFAEARGRTMVDIAIGALLHQPAVASVIAGATTPAQAAANAAADWVPSVADMTELDALLGGMSARAAEFRRAWPVVLASAFGAGSGAIPIAFYSFGALIGPLTAAFGWSRAQISAAPLFLTVGGLVAGIFAGALADRHGARRVVLVSQALLVFAFASLALLPRSLSWFYAGYAMLAILGAGTMTMTWTRAITGWFVAGRGLALGLSLVGTGLIGALLPSYVNRLVASHGWQGAFVGLAALPLVLGLPLTLAFFREPEEAGRRDATAPAIDDRGFTLKDALATRCFWQMVLSFTIVAVAISAVNVHAVPLLTDRGVDAKSAAAIAGLVGLSVTGGRLVSGFLLDRLAGPVLAFAMFGLPALACLLLSVAGTNLWLCGVAIAVVGLAAGAEHDIAAYFCARYFGRRHYGKVYGLLYTLYGVGAGAGPFVAGWMVGDSKDYRLALHAGSALFAVAAGLILTLKAPPASELREVAA